MHSMQLAEDHVLIVCHHACQVSYMSTQTINKQRTLLLVTMYLHDNINNKQTTDTPINYWQVKSLPILQTNAIYSCTSQHTRPAKIRQTTTNKYYKLLACFSTNSESATRLDKIHRPANRYISINTYIADTPRRKYPAQMNKVKVREK